MNIVAFAGITREIRGNRLHAPERDIPCMVNIIMVSFNAEHKNEDSLIPPHPFPLPAGADQSRQSLGMLTAIPSVSAIKARPFTSRVT